MHWIFVTLRILYRCNICVPNISVTTWSDDHLGYNANHTIIICKWRRHRVLFSCSIVSHARRINSNFTTIFRARNAHSSGKYLHDVRRVKIFGETQIVLRTHRWAPWDLMSPSCPINIFSLLSAENIHPTIMRNIIQIGIMLTEYIFFFDIVVDYFPKIIPNRRRVRISYTSYI